MGWARELAVVELCKEYFYLYNDPTPALGALLDDPEMAPYVPATYKYYVHTRRAEFGRFFSTLVNAWGRDIDAISFLAALLGVAVWITFLIRVDTFQKRNVGILLGAVLVGGLFSFLAAPIYSIIHYRWEVHNSTNWAWDFLYWWGVVGLVEEVVKLLPLLILWRTTKLLRSPMDFILYASLFGLGFAFVENLQYFEDGAIRIIHGRLLLCVVMHMFMSATVAYGIVLAKWKYKRPPLPFLALSLVVAAFIHGAYDFFVTHAVGIFFFFHLLIFIWATLQYSAYLNNCLNQSPFLDMKALPATRKLAVYLLSALIAILLFEFVAFSWVYSPAWGNEALSASMITGSFLMFFMVLNLSFIDVVPGEWFWLRMWNFGTHQDYNQTVGQRLELRAYKPGSLLADVLPAHGVVVSRVAMGNGNRYFLFRFEPVLTVRGFPLEYVLICARDKDATIEPHFDMVVAVTLIRDKEALARKRKRKEDFRHLDYVVVA